MAVFMPKTEKRSVKAFEYFTRLANELDLDKYNLPKYKELFMLSSFQAMYDADLAFHHVYIKCSQNAYSKETLLSCLAAEEVSFFKHPDCFDNFTFRQNLLHKISDIRHQLISGSLQYLFR